MPSELFICPPSSFEPWLFPAPPDRDYRLKEVRRRGPRTVMRGLNPEGEPVERSFTGADFGLFLFDIRRDFPELSPWEAREKLFHELMNGHLDV